MRPDRFIGIDFSGDKNRWRMRSRHPNVWVATVRSINDNAELENLISVQELPGDGEPFSRLCKWLTNFPVASIGIDAPFSIPARHVPGSHQELLRRISAIVIEANRPFPSGAQLLSLADKVATILPGKAYRGCESYWREKGVATRSALWNGPRPGAPFAVACMALLAGTGLPCWPWFENTAPLLVEAFPAAQLRHWRLPHKKYSGAEGEGARKQIIEAIEHRLRFSASQIQQMTASPDALDAVIASFAAIAVSQKRIAVPPPAERLEGWIAVHQ